MTTPRTAARETMYTLGLHNFSESTYSTSPVNLLCTDDFCGAATDDFLTIRRIVNNFIYIANANSHILRNFYLQKNP